MPPARRALRSGRREPTHLTPEEWPEAGAWLRDLVEKSGTSKRSVLAAMGYVGGTNRLNSYYSGKRLPKPETLRAICSAANLSYVEVVGRFGFYREIIQIFDDLVWLGECWMQEDGAFGRPTIRLDGVKTSFVDSIHSTGVLRWKGQPITWGEPAPLLVATPCDPREDPSFNKRYCLGSWVEQTHGPRNTPRIVRDAMREANSSTTIVPKPIGVAILLAALAFPRRGDIYKDGARDYRERLGREAHGLAIAAKTRRSEKRVAGRPRKLHNLLQRACDVLDDPRFPFDLKRPMAGEYIVAWADSICQLYTHYARLAAFEFWGEAGSEMSNVTPFVELPQHRKAELPEIEGLTTYL